MVQAPGTIAASEAGAPTTVTFPDVCKTPTPGGPIPIPYPNIGQSSDRGSKSVKVDGEAVSLPKSDFTMTTGDEPGTADASPGPVGPVGPSGPAGPAGLTERLPGPLKGLDLLLMTALILALVAGIVVVAGNVGLTHSRKVLHPISPEEVPTTAIVEEITIYDASDGGMYAAGVAIIALLLFLAALMALLAMMRARTSQARPFLLGGIGLAVGALVASIAASIAFDSWASREGFNEWEIGSSMWGGMVGSILLIVLFAVPMRSASPVKVGSPPPQSQPALMPPPGAPPMYHPPAQPPPQYPTGQPPAQYPIGQAQPSGSQQLQPYQQHLPQRVQPREPPQ